jgi:hypothetical protein
MIKDIHNRTTPFASTRGRAAPGSLRTRVAFTLLELVAVMWGLAILMLLSATLLVGVFKIHEATDVGFNQASRLENLVDQFREDVAQAVAAPEKFERFTAGPTCLILERPDGQHIVYSIEDGRPRRWRYPKGDVYPLHTAKPGTRMEFLRAADAKRLIIMRLTPPVAHKSGLPGSLDIAAALGGDML